MRIFKFRAWDEKKGRYYLPDDEDGDGNKDEWYGDDWQVFCGALNGLKDSLEQFTGLLDRNGREIYEGDIVQCYSHPSCELVQKKVVDFYEFRETIWSKEYHDGRTRVEVIGNIHQNPELLTPSPAGTKE
jgi:uncharacterized phage protein (TIGR01671 family)